jgi:hypothetical protein
VQSKFIEENSEDINKTQWTRKKNDTGVKFIKHGFLEKIIWLTNFYQNYQGKLLKKNYTTLTSQLIKFIRKYNDQLSSKILRQADETDK